MLQGFLGRLGYTDVNVVYTSPTAVAKSARSAASLAPLTA